MGGGAELTASLVVAVTAAAPLAAAAAIAAVSDWWAVAQTPTSRVQLVAKPGVMVALIGVALAVDPFDRTVRALVVAGLVWSLVGDVVLMVERWPFIGGLGAFLVAHVLYVIAFVVAGQSAWAALGVALVVVALAVVGRPLVRAVGARGHAVLTGGVVAYMGAISAMVVTAFGAAHPVVAAASVAFFVSDSLLGWDRFVRPLHDARRRVHVTYHLAQAGFVAWLVVG